MSRTVRCAASLALLVLAGACREAAPQASTGPFPVAPPEPQPFAVMSPAFRDGDALPLSFTCQGGNLPPLEWRGTPPSTTSLALMVYDPDVPLEQSRFWMVWNIRPTATSVRQALAEGKPSHTPWRPPCPPERGRRRIAFALFALAASPELSPDMSEEELHKAMFPHVLAKSVLTAFVQPWGTPRAASQLRR